MLVVLAEALKRRKNHYDDAQNAERGRNRIVPCREAGEKRNSRGTENFGPAKPSEVPLGTPTLFVVPRNLVVKTLRYVLVRVQLAISLAAQRIGVQRPATALTGPDPADTVSRQTVTEVNWKELLLVRCNALLGRSLRCTH